MDQRHAVGKGARAANIVRHHYGLHIPLLLQVDDQLPNLGSGDGIQAGGRLVEQNDLGIERQGPREADALLHAARNLGGQFVEILVLNTDAFQQLAGAFAPLVPGAAGVPHQRKFHVLFHREGVVESRLLEQKPQFLPHFVEFVRAGMLDLLPENADGPRVGRREADQHFEQHALARPAAA